VKRVPIVQLATALASVAMVLALVFRAGAQAPAGPATGPSGFSFPYKDKAGVLKARFTGASSTPKSPTLHLVRQFRVETFRGDGTPDLVGEAPECLLDLSTKDVSSAGQLAVRRSDGQFSVRGEGFSWNHESGRLELSNKVHVTFRADPFASASKPADPPRP
jgi:hypothetical protein